MIKLLVAGAEGQLGRSFLTALNGSQKFTVSGYSKMNLDITNIKSVEAVIAKERPDYVINTAAYTKVDQAESDKGLAFRINQLGPANLARVCRVNNIPMIHFSTDYVFDGSVNRAWLETDQPAPLNVYGASKFAGEQEIQSICDKHLILRTSWLFSPFGENFVRSMLRLGAERSSLAIVSDQIGKPTSTFEIVRFVLQILPVAHKRWGLYHLAQPESVSWYDFAREIFAQAKKQGFGIALDELSAIGSADYSTPAVRPKNSQLDCAQLETAFNFHIRPWRQSLAETLRLMEAR